MEDATAAGHSATAQTIQQFSLRMGIAVGFCFADGLCRPARKQNEEKHEIYECFDE